MDVVRQRIEELADRGVFRGWSELPERRGKARYRFRWLLGAEFDLVVDPARNELLVRNFLPGIENRSFIDSDLRRFVATRSDAVLPAHRRLDPDRVSVTYTNRKQNISLIMRVLSGDEEYPIKALLGLLNDLFSHLQLYHFDYLVSHFGMPDE